MGLSDEMPVKCGEYFEVELNADTTILKIRFDMSVEVIEREWAPIPEGDYHLIRWIDGVYGLCNKDCMLKCSKIVLHKAKNSAQKKRLCSQQTRFTARKSPKFRHLIWQITQTALLQQGL